VEGECQRKGYIGSKAETDKVSGKRIRKGDSNPRRLELKFLNEDESLRDERKQKRSAMFSRHLGLVTQDLFQDTTT